MSHNQAESFHNPWKDSHSATVSKMLTREQVLIEMQQYVHGAAEPARPGETAKEAIARAARVLNMGFSRAREFWYGRARSVPAEEREATRAAYRRHVERLEAVYAHRAAALRQQLEEG